MLITVGARVKPGDKGTMQMNGLVTAVPGSFSVVFFS